MRMKDNEFQYENVGIYLCIFSVILITISFAFLPLSTYDGIKAGFHPLFPVLIIGLSLIGLGLTFLHERTGVRVGTLVYFVPLLILGSIYLSGFESIGVPEDSQYSQWEFGMHLVIASLVLQYVGSLLTPLGKILLPPHKKRPNAVDSDAVIGYREVRIGMLKKFTNFLIVLTIILVTIFLVYTPLRALYLI